MKHINVEEFANGALTEQINRAMEEVTKNIQDPNTDPTAARKITVVIALKPNHGRDYVATGIQTKTQLAPSSGAVTVMSMGKNIKTGEVEAIEIGNQIPGQMSFDDLQADAEEVPAVNRSTGEIYETPKSNVVDLRKARQA